LQIFGGSKISDSFEFFKQRAALRCKVFGSSLFSKRLAGVGRARGL